MNENELNEENRVEETEALTDLTVESDEQVIGGTSFTLIVVVMNSGDGRRA